MLTPRVAESMVALMVQALRAKNHAMGQERVARLIGEEGLRGRVNGSHRPHRGQPRDGRAQAENPLERWRFAEGGQPVRVGSILYLATRVSGMYLAAVINLQTRWVLVYSLSDRMRDNLVEQAFLNG